MADTELFAEEKTMTSTVYVGLDVHAETIAVATADDGRNGDIRFSGYFAICVGSLLSGHSTIALDVVV